MQRQNTRQALLFNSGVIFFIRFFPTLANLLVILYFSRQLSLETYGQYQQIWAQYYVLSAIAVAGLPAYALTVGTGGLLRTVRQWQMGKRCLLLLWPLLWACLFALLQFFSGSLVFWLAGSFLLLSVAGIGQEGLLLAGRKFRLLLLVNLLYTGVFLWLHYLFIRDDHSLYWLFSWLLLLHLARSLVFLAPVWRLFKNPEAEAAQQPVSSRLWLHLGIFELSQVVFRWADKFVVSLFLSAGALAIYFNGTLEIPFLPVLLGAAGSALLLQMQGVGSANTLQSKTEMVRISAVVLSSIVLPLFFFLLFFAAPLFRLALSEKYLSSLPVFWIMLLLLPLRAYNFITLLQHLQKGALINLGALLDIVLALSLSFPLYQLMGLPGIALSFVISTYAQVVFYVYYIKKFTGQRITQILPLQNWLWKMGLLGFLFAGIRLYAANWNGHPAKELLPGVIILAVVAPALLFADFRKLAANKRAQHE